MTRIILCISAAVLFVCSGCASKDAELDIGQRLADTYGWKGDKQPPAADDREQEKDINFQKTIDPDNTPVDVDAPQGQEKKAEAVPATYTVQTGDTLWSISKRYYGNPHKWKKIAEANRKLIGGNANLLKPGTVLVMPEIKKEDESGNKQDK